MQEVPHITVSRGDIVVDSVTYRPSLLGLIGRPQWKVCWRRADAPSQTQCQLIDRECAAGSSELDGQPFSYIVRWRQDLRRHRSSRHDESVVTPSSVLQLAESVHR